MALLILSQLTWKYLVAMNLAGVRSACYIHANGRHAAGTAKLVGRVHVMSGGGFAAIETTDVKFFTLERAPN